MGQLIQSGINAFGAYQTAKLEKNLGTAQHTINDANTYAENLVGNAQTDANNLLGQTYADSTNAVRTAQNNVAAANASLANSARSIRNQQAATKHGQEYNTLATNLGRAADAMTRGTISQRLQASEQTGALRAAISNSGTGGATSSQLLSALNVQQSQARQLMKDQNASKTYDGLMQLQGVENSRELDYDFGQTVANIDYAQNVYSPQVYTDKISPIVANDFAPSPYAAGWLAFAGQNWTQTLNQGMSAWNSYRSSSSGTSDSTTGNNEWGFTSSYGSTDYDYSDSNSYNAYAINGAGTSATYGYGANAYAGYMNTNNDFGFGI